MPRTGVEGTAKSRGGISPASNAVRPAPTASPKARAMVAGSVATTRGTGHLLPMEKPAEVAATVP